MSIGENIAAARKRNGLTQEGLAERMGVTFQAVSTWERDENLPDAGRLVTLSEVLDCSIDALFSEEPAPEWTLNVRLFNEEHMFTFITAQARALSLGQTIRALPFMRSRHGGQTRKGVQPVPYVIHPLTMGCHALAMGIREDDVIASVLLHDVVEDTDTSLNELPVGERVKETVRLVSWNTYDAPEPEVDDLYYGNISKDPLACLVKCLDRCSNLSEMAKGFSRKKMRSYVNRTEHYVLPLLDVVKQVPEWNSAAWLLRYQMTALLETFKRLL